MASAACNCHKHRMLLMARTKTKARTQIIMLPRNEIKQSPDCGVEGQLINCRASLIERPFGHRRLQLIISLWAVGDTEEGV